MARIAHGECDCCEEYDRLRISPGVWPRERICGLCMEGRRDIGITDRLELSLWSLLRRLELERK